MHKTWCEYFETCKKGKNCDLALTKLVEIEAQIWWGGTDFPISVFSEKPEYF